MCHSICQKSTVRSSFFNIIELIKTLLNIDISPLFKGIVYV